MATSALELARELIRFDTINPPGNERACAEHLGALLERAGFRVALHDFGEGRANLVARVGGDGERPALCFTGHLDTVPLGLQSWSVDPFEAEVAGGKLWGRGSSDMKSGIAAFVTAAIELADKLHGTPGLELVIVAGEETGCDGSSQIARTEGALGKVGAIVVAEPSSNQPWVGHKGALWLRATAHGVTSHGSMPEKGVNAIYKVSRAVSRLENFAFQVAAHEALGEPTLNVGTIEGGINVNSVPDLASFTIDIRTIPGQGHTSVREEVSRVLNGEVEIETIVDVAGVWTDPADPWIRAVSEIASHQTGASSEIGTASYFTDASVLTPAYGGPPTVILGPGEPDMAHQTNEYCFVNRIDEATSIYMELAKRWCGI